MRYSRELNGPNRGNIFRVCVILCTLLQGANLIAGLDTLSRSKTTSGSLLQSSHDPILSTDLQDFQPAATNNRKLRTTRTPNNVEKRITSSNLRGNNSDFARRPITKKQTEPLSTDCLRKRNEILDRQMSSASQLRSPQSNLTPTHVILRPKFESQLSTSSNETINNNPDGEHVPKCDEKGAYEPIQCHKIGYCWCVNKYGQAIKNSAMMIGEDLHCDPSMYESESNELVVVTGISAQRIKNLLKPGSGSTESTTPNGHVNFEFDSTQDPIEVEGSRHLNSDELDKRHEPTMPLIPNDCKRSRINARERAFKYLNDSIWVPECDHKNEKFYAERQCHKSKICWCVDQSTGLPLRTNEQLAPGTTSNCSEIKKIIELATSFAKPSTPESDPPFYHGSSEFCDTEKRIEFVSSMNNQFRQQIEEYLRQTPTGSAPAGLSQLDPFALNESQVSKWKFTIMDKDLDGKLGDREWSKFKNNFKLVDKPEETEQQTRQQKSNIYSLSHLIILRSQRKCWRDFLEFCGNGDLLNDESIGLSKWLSCTDLPSKTNKDSQDFRGSPMLLGDTYAHSKEAALARSKTRNPFLGILKPD